MQINVFVNREEDINTIELTPDICKNIHNYRNFLFRDQTKVYDILHDQKHSKCSQI